MAGNRRHLPDQDTPSATPLQTNESPAAEPGSDPLGRAGASKRDLDISFIRAAIEGAVASLSPPSADRLVYDIISLGHPKDLQDLLSRVLPRLVDALLEQYGREYCSLTLGLLVPIQCLAIEICIALKWRFADCQAVLNVLQDRVQAWQTAFMYQLGLQEDELTEDHHKHEQEVPSDVFLSVREVMMKLEPDFNLIGSQYDTRYLDRLILCGSAADQPPGPVVEIVSSTPLPSSKSSRDWPFRRKGNLTEAWDQWLLAYHERVTSEDKDGKIRKRFKHDYVPDAAIYTKLGVGPSLFYKCISGRLGKNTTFYRKLQAFLKSGELP